MISTMRVKTMTGAEEEWSADIEIDSKATLDDLHRAIQRAVEFDNDHLYAFYTAKNAWTRRCDYLDDENGKVFSLTLEDIYPLPARHSLFYLFDFGDSWRFRVTRTRKPPQEPKAGVDYPRVVKEVGTKPEQY